MKLLTVVTLSLFSLSTFASETSFSQQNLKSVLKVATCQLRIIGRPVVFGKEQGQARLHRMVFFSHEATSLPRRLRQGRVMKIQAISSKKIELDDVALNSLCLMNESGKKCDRDIHKLTLEEIQARSGNNVRIDCRKDPIQDI